MTAIEVVVTDLDGTLWEREGQPHATTREAIDELIRRDVTVLVATGRRRRSARKTLAAAGLDFLPAILVDGAAGCVHLDEPSLFLHAFEEGEIPPLVALLGELDLEPIFDTDDLVHDRLAGTAPGPYRQLITDETTLVCDLGEVLPLPPLNALVVVPRDRAESVLRALNALDSGPARVAFEPPQAPEAVIIRVRPAGASKWEGIRRWLTHHGRGTDGVLAVGDYDNDVEMLLAADVALAVETGSPAARAAADFIIRPPSEGGWAAVLDYLG